jgi:hypothetical protein
MSIGEDVKARLASFAAALGAKNVTVRRDQPPAFEEKTLMQDSLRIPRDGDPRSELLSITIAKRVRVLDGGTDPLGDFRKNLSRPRNGINQTQEVWNKNTWLPECNPLPNTRLENRKGPLFSRLLTVQGDFEGGALWVDFSFQ